MLPPVIRPEDIYNAAFVCAVVFSLCFLANLAALWVMS